jgi:hypothetical protein
MVVTDVRADRPQATPRTPAGDRNPLALDAAEGTVHEVGPDLALALVKAPVIEMLEHEHPQGHRSRRARATPPRAERPTPREGLHHHVEQALVLQFGVDAPEHGVPELVAIGQQHLGLAERIEKSIDREVKEFVS